MLLVLELPHRPPVLVPRGIYSSLIAVWLPLCPAGEVHMPKLKILISSLIPELAARERWLHLAHMGRAAYPVPFGCLFFCKATLFPG